MNPEELREYCLAKKGTTEAIPFGPDVLVFRVMLKMYVLLSLKPPDFSANMKCEPEKALELRDSYPDTVLPGYHMNKKTWNTVMLAGELNTDEIKELIDHSYDEVVKNLKKAEKEALAVL